MPVVPRPSAPLSPAGPIQEGAVEARLLFVSPSLIEDRPVTGPVIRGVLKGRDFFFFFAKDSP